MLIKNLLKYTDHKKQYQGEELVVYYYYSYIVETFAMPIIILTSILKSIPIQKSA